jgi:hypothetical protein
MARRTIAQVIQMPPQVNALPPPSSAIIVAPQTGMPPSACAAPQTVTSQSQLLPADQGPAVLGIEQGNFIRTDNPTWAPTEPVPFLERVSARETDGYRAQRNQRALVISSEQGINHQARIQNAALIVVNPWAFNTISAFNCLNVKWLGMQGPARSTGRSSILLIRFPIYHLPEWSAVHRLPPNQNGDRDHKCAYRGC